MSSGLARRGLQVFLGFLGSVALVSGLGTVLFGVESIVGAESVSATVDSEMRFFAVWYAGAGAFLLRAVPRVESERMLVRAIAGLFFVAGCSRGLSWLMVGKPHTLAVALMVVELALPFVILPWQAAVARGNAAAST